MACLRTIAEYRSSRLRILPSNAFIRLWRGMPECIALPSLEKVRHCGRLAWLVLTAAILIPAGCSPRRALIGQVGRIVQDGQSAFEQETDLYLLSQSFPATIKLLETLSASAPRDVDLLVLIARLYGGYAFAILETEHEALRYGYAPVIGAGLSRQQIERQLSHCFRAGADHALDALALRHADVRQQLHTARGAAALFASLDRSDVPALFWYGFNLAGHVQYNLDSVAVMSQAHLVESAMRRVLELESPYYHYSAHLVLMVYYASRAPMMGGNPKLAQWHYDQHRRAMPQPMRLRELYRARYILVRDQRREAFTRSMTELTAAVPFRAPLGLLDSVSAARAAVYLRAVDRLFN